MKSIPLRKPLGQHHLKDPSLCAPVVDFLRPAGARVLEIGPGGGVLTRELVRAGAGVWALELDPAWAFELSRRLGSAEVATAVGDALDLVWQRLPKGTLVAGNLPFNVGTQLIERLLLGGGGVPRAGFLVQKEVGERLVAPPSTSAYGALSVLVAARADARLLGSVPRSRFRPPPRVDGAFVGFELHEPPFPQAELPAFIRTVRAAFSLRRKTLRNSLASAWGKSRAAMAVDALGVGSLARAQELDLDDFVRLYRWSTADLE
jgi:16S rRNA (adenine1518-N6/adenine1519-N6)-dimethyltransferase